MKSDDTHIATETCPICGKEFIFNGMSIYKLVKNHKTRWYCSYTCWRKDGGDNGRKYFK